MDEKNNRSLTEEVRRSYYFAAAFSATVFLAITSVLFFLLLTTPSGIAYLEESPKEMITGVIVLPALLAVGIYLLLYYLFVKTTYETFNQAFKGTYVLQIVETAGGFSNLSYSPKNGLDYNEIRDSHVVNSGEYKYFKSEDQLSGTLYAIPFSYSDVVTPVFKAQWEKVGNPHDFQRSGHALFPS